MKIAKLLLKTVTMLTFLGGISSFAQTNVVYSVNMVGFQKIDGPTLFQGSVPFIGTESLSVQDVIGPQLTGGTLPSNSDNLWFWETNQYRRLFLGAGLGAGFDGLWLEENYSESTKVLAPGEGFWIVRNSGGTNEIVVVGEVIQDASVTNIISTGLNLISYPYSSDLNIQDININTNNGAIGNQLLSNSDNIWIWDADSSQYTRLFLGGQGLGPGFDNVWLTESYGAATNVVKSGTAFWYVRKGASPLTWTEDKPY